MIDPYENDVCDSPDTLTALIEYLEAYATAQAASRALLMEEKAVELTAQEVAFSSAVRGFEEDVSNFAWHMSLRRTVDECWRKAWHEPSPATQYLLWDHMVL